MVPGHPRRTDRAAAVRRLLAGPDLPALRHGDGLHHLADSEQLLADLAKMNDELRARAPRTQRIAKRTVLVLFAILWVLGALARNTSAADFAAQTADGTRVAAPLLRLAEDGSLRLGSENPVEVRGPELLDLRRTGAPLPPPPDGPQLILVNGDRIPAEFLAFADDRVRVKLPAD